jgi:hypothetical protein
LLNHGITAGGTRNHQLGAGMGDFIERYIFPGGELMHVSKVTEVMSEAQFEPLDLENLRPHYARTLWAWSDALEANLAKARESPRDAWCAPTACIWPAARWASSRAGWRCSRCSRRGPAGTSAEGPMRGAQSQFPFNRALHATDHDLQVQIQGRRRRHHDGPEPATTCCARRQAPAPQGIIETGAMPAAIAAHRAAVAPTRRARSRPRRRRGRGQTLPPRDGVTCASAPGRWSR